MTYFTGKERQAEGSLFEKTLSFEKRKILGCENKGYDTNI